MDRLQKGTSANPERHYPLGANHRGDNKQPTGLPPPPRQKKIPGQICSHVVHINALCISNN